MDELEAWIAARLTLLVEKRRQPYISVRTPVEVRRAEDAAAKALTRFKKALDREGIDYEENDETDT